MFYCEIKFRLCDGTNGTDRAFLFYFYNIGGNYLERFHFECSIKAQATFKTTRIKISRVIISFIIVHATSSVMHRYLTLFNYFSSCVISNTVNGRRNNSLLSGYYCTQCATVSYNICADHSVPINFAKYTMYRISYNNLRHG